VCMIIISIDIGVCDQKRLETPDLKGWCWMSYDVNSEMADVFCVCVYVLFLS
jgi:hypothetical protein